MSAASKIEWTDASWNPIVGCSIVSPGCTNCYAMRQAHRLAANPKTPHYRGTTETVKGKPVWTGKVAAAPDRVWEEPLRWRKPRRIFVNSMGDLFHESVDETSIDKAFAIMALCPHHVFQVLTKRAARMRDYFESWPMDGQPDRITELACEIAHFFGRGFQGSGGLADRPLPNVWLGVSAERQAEADERIPDLLATPARLRFLSVEPMLGHVDLRQIAFRDGDPRHKFDALTGQALLYGTGINGNPDIVARMTKPIHPPVDWVIAGGESGPGARPAHPDWFRSIRDQCAAAGVPFFFKQWGAWSTVYDRDRDDPDWRHCPKTQSSWERGPLARYVNLEGGYGFHGERVCFARRVGKAAAGRTLDGRTHDAMPEPAR